MSATVMSCCRLERGSSISRLRSNCGNGTFRSFRRPRPCGRESANAQRQSHQEQPEAESGRTVLETYGMGSGRHRDGPEYLVGSADRSGSFVYGRNPARKELIGEPKLRCFRGLRLDDDPGRTILYPPNRPCRIAKRGPSGILANLEDLR